MAQLTWLITGCSSGFGQEFVQQILDRGDRVIATARRPQKLAHLEAMGAHLLELDVTSPQETINAVVANAIKLAGPIDVLVNNAGFVAAGSWEDLEYEDFLASCDTNFFGPIKVTKAILPHFRQKQSGTMVFVSSLSGWVGHAFTGAYASSKFALEGAVESLHLETSPLGLRTLLLEPGRFRTNLLSAGNLQSRASKHEDYRIASNTYNMQLKMADMKQEGDPVKFVRVAIDLVKGEGCAAGKEVPFRIPLGTDSVLEIQDKMAAMTKVMEDWKPVVEGMGFE